MKKNTLKVLGAAAVAAAIGISLTGCGRGRDAAAAAYAAAAPAAALAAATPPAAAGGADAAPAAARVDPAGIDNWDTFLAEYERFMMGEYIPLVHRMNAGDIAAVMDFQETRNRIAQWYQSMQTFALTAGEPTDAQQAKLEAIENRIAAALGD